MHPQVQVIYISIWHCVSVLAMATCCMICTGLMLNYHSNPYNIIESTTVLSEVVFLDCAFSITHTVVQNPPNKKSISIVITF